MRKNYGLFVINFLKELLFVIDPKNKHDGMLDLTKWTLLDPAPKKFQQNLPLPCLFTQSERKKLQEKKKKQKSGGANYFILIPKDYWFVQKQNLRHKF